MNAPVVLHGQKVQQLASCEQISTGWKRWPSHYGATTCVAIKFLNRPLAESENVELKPLVSVPPTDTKLLAAHLRCVQLHRCAARKTEMNFFSLISVNV